MWERWNLLHRPTCLRESLSVEKVFLFMTNRLYSALGPLAIMLEVSIHNQRRSGDYGAHIERHKCAHVYVGLEITELRIQHQQSRGIRRPFPSALKIDENVKLTLLVRRPRSPGRRHESRACTAGDHTTWSFWHVGGVSRTLESAKIECFCEPWQCPCSKSAHPKTRTWNSVSFCSKFRGFWWTPEVFGESLWLFITLYYKQTKQKFACFQRLAYYSCSRRSHSHRARNRNA